MSSQSSASPPSITPALLRVRLTSIVSSLVSPIPGIDSMSSGFSGGQDFSKVPVLRVFGLTEGGQRASVVVHGAFPYLYIDYPRELDLNPETVTRHISRLGAALNIALGSKMNRSRECHQPRNSSANAIQSITLVKGTPFYGYHVGHSHFLRIAYLRPSQRWTLMEVLDSGAICRRKWEVYEGHLGFRLQFMCDFGLQGCGWLEIGDARFREPLPDIPDLSPESQLGTPSSLHVWARQTVPPHRLHPHPSPPRSSHSSIEIDVHVSSILNRLNITPRPLHHNFAELNRPPSSSRKLLDSLEELWEDERRRRREKGRSVEDMGKLTYEEREAKAMGMPGKKVGWNTEPRWWAEIDKRKAKDRETREASGKPAAMSFEELVNLSAQGTPKDQEAWNKHIPTTFEALTKGWLHNALPSRAFHPSLQPPVLPPAASPYDLAAPYANVLENPYTGLSWSAASEEPADVDFGLVYTATQKAEADEVEAHRAELDGDETSELGEDDSQEPWLESEFELEREEQRCAQSKGKRIADAVGQDHVYGDDSDNDQTPSPSSSVGTARSDYPFGEFFTAGSTHRQRRSPKSPVRVSPLRSLSRFGHSSAPSTPSRLRQETGISMSDDEDEKDMAEDPGSPLARRGAPLWPLPSPDERSTSVRVLLDVREAAAVPSTCPRESAGSLKVPAHDPQSPFLKGHLDATDTSPLSPTYRSPYFSAMPLSEPSPAPAGDNDDDFPMDATWIATALATEEPRFPSLSSSSPEDDEVPLLARASAAPVLRSNLASQRVEAPARPMKRVRLMTSDILPVAEEDSSGSILKEETSKTEQTTLATSRLLVVAPPSSAAIPASASSATPDESPSSQGLPSFPATPYASSAEPPSVTELLATFEPGKPSADLTYQNPFYSKFIDQPRLDREFAGRLWSFKDPNPPVDFEPACTVIEVGWRATRSKRKEGTQVRRAWEFIEAAPSKGDVQRWIAAEVKPTANTRKKRVFASQVEGPTQADTQGFKFSQINEASSSREKRFMSVLSLEVFAVSKDGHLPNYKEDPVVAAFYCFQSDGQAADNCNVPGCHVGVIFASSGGRVPPVALLHGIRPMVVETELELFNGIVDLVRELDPDILSGWEVQSSSWGYIARRDKLYAGNFRSELSPILDLESQEAGSGYNADHSSDFQVEGRHVFNLWRLLKRDLNLNQYTLENCVFHLLHRRIPRYTPHALFKLYIADNTSHVARILDYFLCRVIINIEMLDVSELISKNAEFARVYGVDFADVYMRGSQFKVESFMFRLAKPESLLLLTPSKDQVGAQAGAECIPMVMEPQSAYYKDPVVVLDFQSLYPSVMIAYNICYSTCLGRADRLPDKDGNPTDRFGFSKFELEPGMLELLEDYITVSPNGIVFVKPTVRKSLLAKMLSELLDTRVMVKTGMKGAKHDKGLMRVLNARQLALKLLANVTYGYTSASFSGRMPHVQIADSIVQYGRESLERAITLINTTAEWRAKVVYGDTDSLFIHLPGRSKDQAFLLGNQIADAITAQNPAPMKMKFEKVYLPCVLQSKKRYVGAKYETPDDFEPVFDDKGIETVRRDGVPAQQKMLERCIKILFRTQNLSEVKEYCQEQWSKIVQGRVPIHELTFAKEVKLGTYSEKCNAPHVIVAAIRALQDPSDEPQYGERVPYVIVKGEPGEPQYRRARRPEEVLADRSLSLDSTYYIEKMLVPPLQRIFQLVGADVESWWREMKAKVKVISSTPFRRDIKEAPKPKKQRRIDEFYQSDLCFLCQSPTELVPSVCGACRSRPVETALSLTEILRTSQTRQRVTQLLCGSCSSTPALEPMECVSLDCPIYYERVGSDKDVEDVTTLQAFVDELMREPPVLAESAGKGSRRKNGDVAVVIDGTDW